MISAKELYEEFVARLISLSRENLVIEANEVYGVIAGEEDSSDEIAERCAAIEISNMYH